MSFLGKLLGTLNQAEFAQLVMEKLRTRDKSRIYKYAPEHFTLTPADDPTSAHLLGNAYQEYHATPRRLRRAVLQRWV